MLSATTTLAGRVEQAEAAVAADFAAAARNRGKEVLLEPIAGTTAVYGGPGEPFNKIAGLGFSGAATVPAHRRQGVQSALLRARLVDAAAQGRDLAVVTTEPASKSQLNVQRAGFALLYSRAILRRVARR